MLLLFWANVNHYKIFVVGRDYLEELKNKKQDLELVEVQNVMRSKKKFKIKKFIKKLKKLKIKFKVARYNKFRIILIKVLYCFKMILYLGSKCKIFFSNFCLSI